MTTAIERLVRECPEGEWLPEGWSVLCGQVHKMEPVYKRTPTTIEWMYNRWCRVPRSELTSNFILAVQGRLAELLVKLAIIVIPLKDGTFCAIGVTVHESGLIDPVYEGEETFPTYLDALADVWIAVGRG